MSTLISDVRNKALFMGNVSSSSKVQRGQNEDCFTEIFDKTQNSADSCEMNSFAKTKDTDSVKNCQEKQNSKASERLKEQNEAIKNKKNDNLVKDAVTEAADEMKKQVADTFGVTEEEVELVLETLGLTVFDLLNPENLTQVVLMLNPECDALSLTMNEDLYISLKNLMNTAQELKGEMVQEYNLSEEDLNFVLNAVKEIADEQVVLENVSELTDDAEVVNLQNSEQNVEVTDSFSFDTTVIPKTESTQDVRNSSREAKDHSGSSSEQSFGQNFMNQLTEAVENTNSTTGVETSSYGVRGQDIINQITEQIKVHVKQDATEMELQLHPASLGNVKVQITSAGGVLTAVFTTENESVKAALESQLIQLKDNFVQQGLKVESIEVNVSAQGFERSLDQQEQEQNRFEENRSKKGNRRIRLRGLDGEEDIFNEDLTADDRIVADMMIRNGNTVDYTV